MDCEHGQIMRSEMMRSRKHREKWLRKVVREEQAMKKR